MFIWELMFFSPPVDFLIDCLDFMSIEIKMQKPKQFLPSPTTVKGGGGTGTGEPQSDIDCLTNKLGDIYQASHDIREETFTPWDAVKKTGIPD